MDRFCSWHEILYIRFPWTLNCRMKVLYVQYCVNFRSFLYGHFHSGSDLLTLSHTVVSIKIEVAWAGLNQVTDSINKGLSVPFFYGGRGHLGKKCSFQLFVSHTINEQSHKQWTNDETKLHTFACKQILCKTLWRNLLKKWLKYSIHMTKA